MKKVKKGERGYISYMKRLTLIRTLLMFALSGIIFAAGYIYNGKKENILTVVAVLGVLPACRSLVNFIMFMRFKSTDIFAGEDLEEELMLDLVFTTEKDGSHFAKCAFCRNQSMIVLAEAEQTGETFLEKHIRTLLKKNELSSVGVKVFKDEKKFRQRMRELLERPETDNETTLRARALIGAITL